MIQRLRFHILVSTVNFGVTHSIFDNTYIGNSHFLDWCPLIYTWGNAELAIWGSQMPILGVTFSPVGVIWAGLGGGWGGLHGVVAKHEVLSITEPLFCTKIRGGMGGGVSTPFWGYFWPFLGGYFDPYFGHFLAILGYFWHFWPFLVIFGLFWLFLVNFHSFLGFRPSRHKEGGNMIITF